jgi:proteic killer suppression protein
MEITFAKKKWQELCEQERLAQKRLGAKCAKKLKTQLAIIRVANCVKELVIGNPHPLIEDRAGQFAVNLEGGNRLVFKPDDDPIPLTNDGSIDWPNVTAVCIVFIGDYHD